jgi:hypothetical protein
MDGYVTIGANRYQVFDRIDTVQGIRLGDWFEMVDLDCTSANITVSCLEVEPADETGCSVVTQTRGTSCRITLMYAESHLAHSSLRVILSVR